MAPILVRLRLEAGLQPMRGTLRHKSHVRCHREEYTPCDGPLLQKASGAGRRNFDGETRPGPGPRTATPTVSTITFQSNMVRVIRCFDTEGAWQTIEL